MLWLTVKYIITAGIVVLISEVAKRSDRLGGLIAALPLVTIMVLIWMKIEGQSELKIANHAWYTFLYVVPTLPMFLLFPLLYQNLGFGPTLLVSCIITIFGFIIWALLLNRFGIKLI
ncbi:DUF3147 family protein [Acetobacteraceae bacterium ESL0709]|nr:DUF3147 family protein [Acetobacteraceae bacterium ESL0697]MDF7678331.1 DUF3147 family protein [Acetobacteraceae bacterium ESL0709]